jgi:hypothetical protein
MTQIVASGHTHLNTDQMEVECQRVIGGVRGSLLELYAALSVDPEQPQEAIRKFRVNKNLAWKVSKILSAQDGLTSIQHFPGGAGWEIMLGAMKEAWRPRPAFEPRPCRPWMSLTHSSRGTRVRGPILS